MAFEKPLKQDGVDFVRVHKAAVLCSGADAIGIAISCETGVTFFLYHGFLQHADVRLNGLGINSGKQRVDLASDLDVRYAALSEDIGQHIASGTVHAIDGDLEIGLCDLVEISELRDCGDVRRLEVCLLNFCGHGFWHGAGPDLGLNLGDDGRGGGASIIRLELDAVPAPGIVAGGNHHTAGRAKVFHRV